MDDVLPFVVFGVWVLFVVVLLLVNRRAMSRAVRERVLVFGGAHEWRVASELEFSGLGRDFYDDCQAGFERCGFGVLGDIEDATLRGTAFDPRSFRRVMVSGDGLAVAEFWVVRRGFWKRFGMFRGFGDCCCVRIFSEAEDGRIFSVARVPEGLRGVEPEEFDVRYMGGGVEDLWFHFRGDMGAFSDWGFVARRFQTLRDVMESEDRQQVHRIAMRKNTGLLTAGDLKRMGMSGRGADVYMRAFFRELKRQGGWP